jgi:Outer membrane protein beta-barrel domain
MKTNLIAIALCLTALIVFAGPTVELAPAPSPAPAAYFKANEFDFSLGGLGSWTQTPYHRDRYFGLDHAFGGTLEAKYFFTQNIGAGISFSGYDARNSNSVETGSLGQKLPPGILATGTSGFVGDVMLKAVYRYPIGQVAPYAFIGGGAIFNGGNSTLTEPSGTVGKKFAFGLIEHDVKMIGEAGAGVEYRFTPNFGAFMEGAFDKIDRPNSNFYSIRTGLTIAF